MDFATLNEWVRAARQLAKDADRSSISDQYIGKMLSHSPADPDDGVWPHRTIRDGLETWKAEEIERGISVGKINARGVITRAPLDGGKQERDLALRLRDDASKLDAWPRAKAVLVGLAERWEYVAEREDLRVEQMRLKD